MLDFKIELKDSKTKKTWNTFVKCKDNITSRQLFNLVREAIDNDIYDIALTELIDEGILPNSTFDEIEDGLTVQELISNKKAKTEWVNKYKEVVNRISFTKPKNVPSNLEFPFKEELFETINKKTTPIKTKEDYKNAFIKKYLLDQKKK